MRRLLIVSLLTLVASSAAAFTNDELLSTIAMPLAVDAVASATGVDNTRLGNFVAALNQANVAPTQVVEVVRYVPVALQPQASPQLDIVQFVRDQVSQGVTADALVNAIVQQLSAHYNVTPQLALNAPAMVAVERTDYIPTDVLSRVSSGNPLAAIGLPLAVAAVANLAGVPQDQLASLVATLNNANVPIAQEIQIVRYVPVALVDNGPQFVQFVQQQTSRGVTGPALVPVVTQQLRTYYPASSQIEVSAPAQTTFTPEPPPVVVQRVTEVRLHPMHPHGGPPGQLKKQLGLQTGAEVVHGGQAPSPVHVMKMKHEKNGRGEQMRPMISAAPPTVIPVPPAQPGPIVVPQDRGHGRGPEGNGPPGQKKEHGNGKGHGKD